MRRVSSLTSTGRAVRASHVLPLLVAVAASACSSDSAVAPPGSFDPIHVQGDFIIAPDTSLLVVGGGRRLAVEDMSQLYKASVGRANWRSSNRSVATVDGAGYVRAVGEGMTTISVTINGRSASAPVFVQRYPAPLRFAQVSVSAGNACGVTSDGAIYCWGGSRLGTTRPTDSCEAYYNGSQGFHRWVSRCSAVPVRVESSEHFRSVVVRPASTCALNTDGALFCWGQVDGENNVVWPLPRRTGGDRSYASVSPPCALTADGDAYCWGSNQRGNLGIGAKLPESVSSLDPVLVSGGVKWKAISSNGDNSCGLSMDGALYCWGENWHAQLGLGPDLPPDSVLDCFFGCRSAPTRVPTTVTFAQLSVGTVSDCALTAEGEAWCWGFRRSGDLLYSPTSAGSQRFRSIATGDMESCAISLDSHLFCWGVGGNFLTLMPPALEPTPVDLPVVMSSVAAPAFVGTCGIGTDQILYCWSSSNLLRGRGELTASGYDSGLSLPDTLPEFGEVVGQR